MSDAQRQMLRESTSISRSGDAKEEAMAATAPLRARWPAFARHWRDASAAQQRVRGDRGLRDAAGGRARLPAGRAAGPLHRRRFQHGSFHRTDPSIARILLSHGSFHSTDPSIAAVLYSRSGDSASCTAYNDSSCLADVHTSAPDPLDDTWDVGGRRLRDLSQALSGKVS
eukprot:scaffold189_cov249-Pinguiococcus_pyrenoidosus.AAC.19